LLQKVAPLAAADASSANEPSQVAVAVSGLDELGNWGGLSGAGERGG